jgi:hypothetical protein
MNAPHDPSPELAALLRLKRHEQPRPGYFDDFVHAFRERQRAELLRVSAWQLFADRVGTHLHDWRFLLQPRWIAPIGAAAALALLALASRPAPTTVAANPVADSGSVDPVGVLPLPAPSSRLVRSPRTIPVSTNVPEAPAAPSNGLRRTPGDALVPVLPATQDGPSPQADHGKVIILVR